MDVGQTADLTVPLAALMLKGKQVILMDAKKTLLFCFFFLVCCLYALPECGTR